MLVGVAPTALLRQSPQHCTRGTHEASGFPRRGALPVPIHGRQPVLAQVRDCGLDPGVSKQNTHP
eukprot:7776891-Lingulodinium_polyedra.AAC.1